LKRQNCVEEEPKPKVGRKIGAEEKAKAMLKLLKLQFETQLSTAKALGGEVKTETPVEPTSVVDGASRICSCYRRKTS
jgi:hypothetical protein